MRSLADCAPDVTRLGGGMGCAFSGSEKRPKKGKRQTVINHGMFIATLSKVCEKTAKTRTKAPNNVAKPATLFPDTLRSGRIVSEFRHDLIRDARLSADQKAPASARSGRSITRNPISPIIPPPPSGDSSSVASACACALAASACAPICSIVRASPCNAVC